MADADRIREIFEPFGPVDVKRMFGGAGIYRDGLCFAIEDGGDIYLKVDDTNRDAFRAAGSRPFVYVMKGEPREMNYWRLLDDAEALVRWARLGFEAAVRAANDKAPKRASPALKPKAASGQSKKAAPRKGKR